MMDCIESARLSMLEARKALENHEGLKGYLRRTPKVDSNIQ
jgi:hypothetical protein